MLYYFIAVLANRYLKGGTKWMGSNPSSAPVRWGRRGTPGRSWGKAVRANSVPERNYSGWEVFEAPCIAAEALIVPFGISSIRHSANPVTNLTAT